MNKILTLVVLGAAFTASSALGATIVTYTDSGSFNSSSIVGGSATVTENFNTNASLFTTFNVAGTVGGTPGFTSGARTTNLTNSYSEVVTLNAGNMSAFGGDFNLAPGSGLGSGVKLLITFADNSTQLVTLGGGGTAILGYNVGNGSTPFFFGFTSDTAFTSVTFVQGGSGGLTTETFSLDNLLVEQSGAALPPPPGGVPEPSTFGLMGAAMVGLGLFRKFRK
jgi:hypothetical protein